MGPGSGSHHNWAARARLGKWRMGLFGLAPGALGEEVHPSCLELNLVTWFPELRGLKKGVHLGLIAMYQPPFHDIVHKGLKPT